MIGRLVATRDALAEEPPSRGASIEHERSEVRELVERRGDRGHFEVRAVRVIEGESRAPLGGQGVAPRDDRRGEPAQRASARSGAEPSPSGRDGLVDHGADSPTVVSETAPL